MMSTCQMQQILAKSDLYHTTSSTPSVSIGSSGIKAHGINQTFNPNSWTIVITALLTASPVYHSQAVVQREAEPLVNHNEPTNTCRRSTLTRTVISGNILPSQGRSTEGSKDPFSDWAIGL